MCGQTRGEVLEGVETSCEFLRAGWRSRVGEQEEEEPRTLRQEASPRGAFPVTCCAPEIPKLQ